MWKRSDRTYDVPLSWLLLWFFSRCPPLNLYNIIKLFNNLLTQWCSDNSLHYHKIYSPSQKLLINSEPYPRQLLCRHMPPGVKCQSSLPSFEYEKIPLVRLRISPDPDLSTVDSLTLGFCFLCFLVRMDQIGHF
jgi:hypothetical protein